MDIPELGEEKEKEEKKEIEEVTQTGDNVAPSPYKFNISKFKEDYINLNKLYWNSENNFKIDESIEKEYLKNDNTLKEKIFTINEENNIDEERIILLVKRDFGLDESKRDATNKEKIFQKLFYISYTCNELISDLCGEINHKGFKYKSIFNFYYAVSTAYNNAINGFINIKNEMRDHEKEIKKYIKEKSKENQDEEAPEVANQIKNKD